MSKRRAAGSGAAGSAAEIRAYVDGITRDAGMPGIRIDADGRVQEVAA
jgi:poly-gamma-glutamate synthesis protein (capsule biosynthesis protein)